MQDSVENSPVQNIIEPLYYGKGWIKFIGILMIISGVLQIFTIIGILYCWLPIWMGVLLMKAAEFVTIAYESDSEGDATVAMDKLRLYFKITGILFVLSFVLMLVGFALSMTLGVFTAISQSGY